MLEIMQEIRQDDEISVSAERRASLSHKGEALYGKYCGTGGRGICAESFAEYHIWRGEYSVARDFLVFLDTQLTGLKETTTPSAEDVEQQHMTETLITADSSLAWRRSGRLATGIKISAPTNALVRVKSREPFWPRSDSYGRNAIAHRSKGS